MLLGPYTELSSNVIAAAIDVHTELGPGLLESTYHRCLCYELGLRGIGYRCEVVVPILYKGELLDAGYRLDLVVEDQLIVELKSVAELTPLHEAQLLTYMKLCNKKVGLLINFNVPRLKDGIKRKLL